MSLALMEERSNCDLASEGLGFRVEGLGGASVISAPTVIRRRSNKGMGAQAS